MNDDYDQVIMDEVSKAFICKRVESRILLLSFLLIIRYYFKNATELVPL